jgi:hypothetical protein
MFHIPGFSIESTVPAILTVAWGTISAYQILVAKLRKRKCVICTRGVQHEDQAPHVAVPCHDHCIFVATLMARDTKEK